MDDKHYWAFLSYSHADRRWAQWFHRALEGYAVPRRLVGRATAMGPSPTRLRPIFRDRDDLEASADLGERITQALAASAWLIVICSPAAARSPWVNQEIVRFKAVHGENRVLAVIVAGEPNASDIPGREAQECFPPALRRRIGADGALTEIAVEPTAADVRPGGDGRNLARLKLIAGMLEVGLDDLVRREAQRGRLQMAVAAAALAAVAVVTSGLAVTALIERNKAEARREQAEGLVEFMLGDLRKKLEPSARLDVLDAVGAKALSYYASEERNGLDDDALGRRARVLHLLGDIRDQRGDLAGALANFQEAANITAGLLAKQPGDGVRVFNHAQSVYYVGYVADRRGDAAGAERAFLDYQRLAARLVAIDPTRDDWRTEVVYANENLGALWLKQNKLAQAETAFSHARDADLQLAAKAPGDHDRQTDLAGVYGWLADAEAGQEKLDQARRDRLSERGIYQALLARQPGDNEVKLRMVQNARALAAIDSQSGRQADAIDELVQATEGAERLMAFQSDNTDYREHAASAWVNYARTLLAGGEIARAGAASGRSLALVDSLVRKDPSVALWHGYMLGAARLVDMRVTAQKAGSEAELRAALAPAIAESQRLSALNAPPHPDLALARVTADALVLAGDAHLLAGDTDQARAAWAKAAQVCLCATLDRQATGQHPAHPADDLGKSRLDDLASLHRAGAGRGLAELKRKWLGAYLW